MRYGANRLKGNTKPKPPKGGTPNLAKVIPRWTLDACRAVAIAKPGSALDVFSRR
jgi:hypothetical protein